MHAAPPPRSRRQFLAATVGAVSGALLPTLGPTAAASIGAAPDATTLHATTLSGASDTLTYAGVGPDATGFHPYLAADAASRLYAQCVFGGGLVRYDSATANIVGDTAASWQRAADSRAYTFTLRDMRWSDGVPVTADDYVWTYQQVMKPEHPSPWREFFAPIIACFAPEPKTLIVSLRERIATSLQVTGAIVALPRHIWERYDWADPAKNPEIAAPTVGNGMWTLREWVPGDHATFAANPSYFDGPPRIGTFVSRVFATPDGAYDALRAGGVDRAEIAPPAYAGAKELPNVAVSEWYAPDGEWAYLGFNLRRPALQEPMLRKAVAHATDRQRIIDELLAGLARPMYSTLTPSSWAYTPDVERYDFDLARARDVLQQAGYSAAGAAPTKDGQPLALTLLHATDRETDATIAALIVRQLRDLGVAVTVRSLDPEAYRAALTAEPFDYDLYLGHWALPVDPSFTAPIWAESAIPQRNIGAYRNPEVEMLFRRATFETRTATRKPFFDQIQARLAEDAPYVFLYEAKQVVGINRRIGGVTVGQLGLNRMNEWVIAPT